MASDTKTTKKTAKKKRARKRRTAVEESDRLTNLTAALGAGVGLVPIPGTSAALTGMELLLIGAIAKIWGRALTEGFLKGMFARWVARYVAILGLQVAGDLIGWIPGFGQAAKSAIAAGCIKFIGSAMNESFADRHGRNIPAATTAEEAKAALEEAAARLNENKGDLAEAAKRAFKGDTRKLAEILNRIFALGDEEPASDP
jgi:uncharacterized protein (DUF697 family)